MSNTIEFSEMLIDTALGNIESYEELDNEIVELEQAMDFPEEGNNRFSDWDLTPKQFTKAISRAISHLSDLIDN